MRREQMSVGVLFQGGAENGDGVIVTNRDGDEFITICKGATVPNAKAGYAVGCMFIKTDTGKLYLNSGTTASCTFGIVTSA